MSATGAGGRRGRRRTGWGLGVSTRCYFLETFGCQMNILDSELVETQLRARGYESTSDYRQAELILFNTCSVRQHAEDKVLSRLGQLKGHKQRYPEKIVGVIGCMAEREKEGLFAKAPHVDLLCGPGELDRLVGLIDEVRERHDQIALLAGSLSRRTEVLQRALEYDSLEALDLARQPADDASVLQSYIRVQRGCDQFCTYCVVPFTRGAERSRPADHIVEEARRLAQRGCREITLLGQTVNSYLHQDAGRPVGFARLIERVHEVSGIDRIRFVTSFPADWDEDIFRVMRDCPRVMPYLHIPAQSGSDRVLERMRRSYTVSSYLRLLDSARKHVPHIALAGDIIVGFCGETEEDHQQTLALVGEAGYSSLYVFKYSPRPGTKADRVFADDVADDCKAARCNEVLAAQQSSGAELRRSAIGSEVEVLVEGFSKLSRRTRGERNAELRTRGKQSPAMAAGRQQARSTQESEQDRGCEVSAESGAQLVGRTPQDWIAVFDAAPEMIGAIVRVRVEDASAHTLFGRVVSVVSPARNSCMAPSEGDRSERGRALPILMVRP